MEHRCRTPRGTYAASEVVFISVASQGKLSIYIRSEGCPITIQFLYFFALAVEGPNAQCDRLDLSAVMHDHASAIACLFRCEPSQSHRRGVIGGCDMAGLHLWVQNKGRPVGWAGRLLGREALAVNNSFFPFLFQFLFSTSLLFFPAVHEANIILAYLLKKRG